MPSPRLKQTTTTLLVFEVLTVATDFMTVAQLVRVTGRSSSAVSAALIHLRSHKAADFVWQGGVSYWIATPDTDNRIRTIQEIVMGSTRPRRRKFRISFNALPR